MLGALVITFGAVALATGSAIEALPGYFGGGSAVFGGIAIAAIVTKIARPEVYVDWIGNAIFYVGAGFTLFADETLHQIVSLILLCSLLSSSALARIWIGVTATPRAAASWMLSSGCVAALAVLWIVLAQVLHIAATPRIVVAIDTLLEGISIAGFAASLAPTRCVRKCD